MVSDGRRVLSPLGKEGRVGSLGSHALSWLSTPASRVCSPPPRGLAWEGAPNPAVV